MRINITCLSTVTLILTISILAGLAAEVFAGPYVDAVMADAPVGYWRLEEGSGTAVDMAPLFGSQNGTYMDGVGTITGPIRSEAGVTTNIAADFAGNSGYVDILDPSGVLGSPLTTAFNGVPWTYELWWLNQDFVGGTHSPLYKGAHAGNAGTFFNRVAGESAFGIRSGISNPVGAPSPVTTFPDPTPFAWTHVVGVISLNTDGGVDSTDARVYVNGNLVETSDVIFSNQLPDQLDNTNQPLTIGALLFSDGNHGNFFAGAVDEVAVYDYALDDLNNLDERDNTRIMAHYLAADPPLPPPIGTWTSPNSGDWLTAINWFNLEIPNSNTATAIFGSAIPDSRTVFADTPVRAKSVTFDNTNEYVVMGNGSLTLDADTGTALVDVQTGSHRIQLPITLADATTVNVEAGTTLIFAGDVNLDVHDLTTQGTGTVRFDHRVSSEGGMVSLSGSMLAGSGSIAADLVITDGGLVVQQDELTVRGDVSLIGSLEIGLVDGFQPSPGESFDVLTAASIDLNGLDQLTTSNFGLAVVADGLGGETLVLTIVPEPAVCFLAGLATCGMILLRRRASRVFVPILGLGMLAVGNAQPAQAQTYSDAVLADNPVGYWQFEEVPADGVTAADTAGGDHNGTIVGPLWSQIDGVDLPGIGGQAVDRGVGNTSWVRVPTTDDPTFAATSFTFEAWLNAPITSNTNGECCGNYMVRGHWSSTDASNPGVSATFAAHNGGAINATINGGGGGQPVVSVPYPSPAPGWHHVVHTFTDNGDATTTIEAFIDGSSAGTININTAMANNNVARDDSDFGLTIGVLPFGAFTGDGFDSPIQAFTGGYDEFAYYDYALSPAQVASHFDAAREIQRELGEWQVPDSGNWKTGSNWFIQEIPDTDTEVVIFGGAISGPRSVYLESDVTVKGVKFDNANAYAIGGNGGVIFDSADTSSVEVVQGNHKFQGSVQLTVPTTATIAADSAVAFDGPLSLTSVLTKAGPGTLNVNSLANSGGGSGIVVNEGTLGGIGEVDGNVTNTSTGTVAPGNSPGILTVDGNYTQGASATLALEIGGLVPGDEHDKLVVNGIATLDGTLDVTLINGFALAGDMLFDVLDFNSVVNDFTAFNLPTGLVWNVSDGSLCFGTCTGGGLTDYDNDGTWGLGDLNLVLFNWNEDGATLPAAWLNSRPGAGTLVGLPELNQVLFNWGQPGSLAVVPEPATTVLMGLGLLGCLVCFRKNQ
jgi:hypothetical protein